MTSALIGRYVHGAHLQPLGVSGPSVLIDEEQATEVRILKQITRDFIIENPSLVGQQKGHELILRSLFECLFTDSKNNYPPYLPTRLRYLWDASQQVPARFVADCLASLTEAEAIGLHRRLTGEASGSVLDPIVR
jgi:dGTPase